MNDDLKTSLAASREKLQQRKRLNAPTTDLLARRISMVARAKETKTKTHTLGKFLEAIQNGRYEKKVGRIRAAYNAALKEHNGDRKQAKDAIRDLKTALLPAAMISGTFKRRHRDAIEQHAGLLCGDLDELGEQRNEVRAHLVQSPHVLACFISPSGDGLKVIIPVRDDVSRHEDSFRAIRAHVLEATGIAIDESGKDVSRLCFASFDAELFINVNAVAIEPLAPEPRASAHAAHSLSTTREPITKERVREMLRCIPAPQKGEYNLWLTITNAVLDALGGNQSDAFAVLNEWSPEWKPGNYADKFAHPTDDIHAGTLVHLAKQHGWQPPQQDEIHDDSDVRSRIIAILTSKLLSAEQQKNRVTKAVLQALKARGRFFYHALLRDFDSAMFFDNDKKRLERIRSDFFAAWLSDWLGLNRAATVFKYVMAGIETFALSGKQTTGIIPETFWAARADAIYLSRSDAEIVKITAGRVEIVANGTDDVLFAAGNTLTPWKLTEPRDPFVTCSVFRDASCAAKHGSTVLRLWIFSLPSNPTSKPPLCLAGVVGSGKTKLAECIAEFFGVPVVTNKVKNSDKAEESFWVSLDHGGIYTLDNADTRTKWLPDSIATAATAGCTQNRKLFTDRETVTLFARAWLIITTANPTFAGDVGLADRLIPVRMNRRLPGDTSDARLSAEIREQRDAGLSFIAHTLSSALADKAPAPSGLNHRHPDFADLAVKIGRATCGADQAVAALRIAEADKSRFCIENDFVGAALLNYLPKVKSFTGTSAQLRDELLAHDADLGDKGISVKRLGKRISMLWPHLQVTFDARKEKDRLGFTVFSFNVPTPVAEFAEFESMIPYPPDIQNSSRVLYENADSNSANSAGSGDNTAANAPETLKDAQDWVDL